MGVTVATEMAVNVQEKAATAPHHWYVSNLKSCLGDGENPATTQCERKKWELLEPQEKVRAPAPQHQVCV